MLNKDITKAKTKREPMSQGKFYVILLILLVLVFVFLLLANFLVDWFWFKEVGYVSVFFTKLFTQLKLGAPLFLVAALLMGVYLGRLKSNYFKKIESKEETNIKRLNHITWGISAIFGLVVAVNFVSILWFKALQFINGQDFNIRDPLFNRDVSFYVFRLDFLSELNSLLIGMIILSVMVTVVYYLVLMVMHSPDVFEEDEAEPIEDGKFTGGADTGTATSKDKDMLKDLFQKLTGKPLPETKAPFKKETNDRRISQSNLKQLANIASGHLIILGMVFFLMVALHFFLAQFSLLHTHTGVVYGAGYTDVHVTLWAYRILMGLAVIGAITTAIFIKKKSVKGLLAVPILMVVVFLASTGLSVVVQNVIVSPDEISKESQYLAHNIEFTQYAYDIDDVDTRAFPATNNLTIQDIEENQETVTNIRINDYIPVQTFYNQTQSIRQYYKFNDVDVDRYNINGEITQTYLSVREIDSEKISDTWINRHIKYTHGYGITLSRVDTITASGQPDVLVKDIPPVSSVEEIQIDRPEIYFGELTNDYIIVNTDEAEFDYPDGEANKYSHYEGKAGIQLNLFNRILFAIQERSLKLLVSTNVNSDSKIIINRDIMTRVNKIMPYLTYEEGGPYGVTVNGKVYWILDAYTTSEDYPYSEPFRGELQTTNYIRNSVEVVIDAYEGTVDYYVVDESDPIAMTYKSIYPQLFKSFDEMPEELAAHMRYPHAMFKIQADVYARYHMTDVQAFYQNEDIWEVAHEIYGTEERKIIPSYFVVKLPGEENAEFVSMLPYTPKSKQNMTALLLTRNDGDHYGELVLYTYPKNRTVYGPMQIEAQIDQNTVISQDFSLWSQAGSNYNRGNLFVVPIGDSLLYVEPVYLEASNTAIPEVKRVIVAYGDKIAYEPTLGEALTSLFGKGGSSSGSSNQGQQSESGDMTQEDYIKQAQQAYENAQQAMKDGDWAAYGKYMEELEKALSNL